MLKRIALFFNMRRWNVWERLLLWRSSVYWGINKIRDSRNRGDEPEGQTRSVHSSCYRKNISWGYSDFGPTDSDQLLLYHWLKKNSLFYANIWVLRASHKSEFILWVQSDTLLVALPLFLTLLAELLANPKAGYHYLDQTIQAHLLTLIRLCHIEQMFELIKTMCNVTVDQK